MAIWKKKSDDGDGGEDKPFQPDPEKARKWFDHAKSMADRTMYEAALDYYARGIKQDPSTLSAHDAMLQAAIAYRNNGGKPASSKELKKIDDGDPVSGFAAAEFAWMKDVSNGSLAIKALEAAVKADQQEWGASVAPTILRLLQSQKKISKKELLNAKDAFANVSAWNEALAAGNLALQLDPRDADLDAELKNLAAQRAMSQGGYEDAAGAEGGFRKFIKDAKAQEEAIEDESITAGASTEERVLARAKAAYEESPTTPDVINTYATALRKTGKSEHLKLAYDVFMKGFADTQEYRFRMAAGDMQIDQLRRKVRLLKEKHEETPEDAAVAEQLAKANEQRLDLEAAEFGDRVSKYPTNRIMKFEYGTVLHEQGKYQDAMGAFQQAKDEPKLRVRAGWLLGRCFASEGWHEDAIAEFREALERMEASGSDHELAVKYDLVTSLIEHAKADQSIDAAQDAKSICSEIIRKDITFRDIRSKRKEVDELLKNLG